MLENEDETVWEYLSRGRPIREIHAELEDVYRQLETATPEQQQGLLERMAHCTNFDYFDQYEADDILLSLIEENENRSRYVGYAARSIVGRAEVTGLWRGCCIPN